MGRTGEAAEAEAGQAVGPFRCPREPGSSCRMVPEFCQSRPQCLLRKSFWAMVWEVSPWSGWGATAWGSRGGQLCPCSRCTGRGEAWGPRAAGRAGRQGRKTGASEGTGCARTGGAGASLFPRTLSGRARRVRPPRAAGAPSVSRSLCGRVGHARVTVPVR